jgi:hypothetical protein
MAAHKGRKGRTGKSTPLLPMPLAGLPPEHQLASGKAMRSEWTDPDDLEPNRRVARVITGYRGFDPLRKCRMRHGDRSSITERHVMAADILRALADGARIGFAPVRDLSMPVQSIFYRPLTGPSRLAERQARCWRRFVRAMASFTRPQRELLTLCALMNVSIARIAEARGCNPPRLMGELVAVLDQLEQYFSSEIDHLRDHGEAE